MKVTVKLEVGLPDGYELVDVVMRPVRLNELFYRPSGGYVDQWIDTKESDAPHVIVRRRWEPEHDKLYFFADNKDVVGTDQGAAMPFKGRDGDKYKGGVCTWNYCWPIPADRVGE